MSSFTERMKDLLEMLLPFYVISKNGDHSTQMVTLLGIMKPLFVKLPYRKAVMDR